MRCPFCGHEETQVKDSRPSEDGAAIRRRRLCPTCEGRGQVKTARSVCYDILREILREARQFNPKEFRVVASASVVEMLLDEEGQHLAALSDFIGKPISLQAESVGSPEQYDIVLM